MNLQNQQKIKGSKKSKIYPFLCWYIKKQTSPLLCWQNRKNGNDKMMVYEVLLKEALCLGRRWPRIAFCCACCTEGRREQAGCFPFGALVCITMQPPQASEAISCCLQNLSSISCITMLFPPPRACITLIKNKPKPKTKIPKTTTKKNSTILP